MSEPVLSAAGLRKSYRSGDRRIEVLRGADLRVTAGESVSIRGESGSGKSVTSYAVMRILDRAGRIAGGEVSFSGIEIGRAHV